MILHACLTDPGLDTFLHQAARPAAVEWSISESPTVTSELALLVVARPTRLVIIAAIIILLRIN
jgi:hypothetical protein